MREDEIIAALQAHEEVGAREFLLHYTPLMLYIISPILKDSHDREECISEIALRVWEKIGLYDPSRGSWTAWLTALSRNTALNRLRSSGLQVLGDEISSELADSAPTPEEQVLQRERKAALSKALTALSLSERNLFFRKYYYMQSTAQIARELGTTERAVEGKLYRIKKRLRKELGGDFYDESI